MEIGLDAVGELEPCLAPEGNSFAVEVGATLAKTVTRLNELPEFTKNAS